MTQIAGVDGCPGGWLCVTLDTDTNDCKANIFPTASELIAYYTQMSVLAIDMPIGLTESGVRRCDELAKDRLCNRHMCVFYAPTRAALFAPSRIAASTIIGRGVTVQEWQIYSKIINLDRAITPLHQRWCFEIHPEISFWAWNGANVMQHKKSSPEGRRSRERLIDAVWPERRLEVLNHLQQNDDINGNHYGHDDINDAFAALWTAQRIFNNQAERLPPRPEVDSRGLRMEIWY